MFAFNINDLTGSFYVGLSLLTDDLLQSAEKGQQESRAVAEKLHDAVCKIRYVSKCTTASRGSPYKSAACPHGFLVHSSCRTSTIVLKFDGSPSKYEEIEIFNE